MKKFLLTIAVGMLLCSTNSISAETVTLNGSRNITLGEAITDASQLTSGKYCIYVYSKGAGAFVHPSSQYLAAKGLTSINSPMSNSETDYIYTITVGENNTFSITTSTGKSFPTQGEGDNAIGKGNLVVAKADDPNIPTALFSLSAETVTGQGDFEDKLFYVQLMNETHNGDGSTVSYICTNGDATTGHLAYWSGLGAVDQTHFTALAFYPIHEETFSVTINTDTYYYLKLSDMDAYLQLETPTSGTLASVSPTVKTPIRFIEGTGDNSGRFAIQNIKNDLYFASNGGWNSIYNNSTPYYWGLSAVDDDIFTIAKQGGGNNLAGPQCNTLEDDLTIWTDNFIGRVQNGQSARVFWTLEEVTDVTRLTYKFVKDGITYGTISMDLFGDQEYTLPAELGSVTGTENGVTTFTFADNVEPFKLSSARRTTQWLSSNMAGLTRTAEGTSFENAEWFVKYNVDGGIKIFSPAQGKFAGTIQNNVQVPLVDSGNAATFILVPNQNGPVGIVNEIGGKGFNLANGRAEAGNIAGWTVGNDASSHWFFVTDNEQFQANLTSGYFLENNANPYNANANFTDNNAWYTAQQNLKDAIAAATAAHVDAADIDEAQALIDIAAIAVFGNANTDIAAQIEAMNASAAALMKKVDALKDITVNFVKDNFTYNTKIYKGSLPIFPASLGSMGELNENDEATFTFADSVELFKLISARYACVWATTNNTGLYHTGTEGTYDSGEFFAMDGTEESFNLFAINTAEYVGSAAINAQFAFSSTPADFTISHSQAGPVAIGCNGVYMNDFNGQNAGNIGGWYKAIGANVDAGSHWFLVFDEETYNQNKNYYWNDNTGFGDGNLYEEGLWFTTVQAAKDAIAAAEEAEIPESDMANLKELIAAAETVNFGKKGTDIGSMIDNIADLTKTLKDVTNGIDEITVDGNGVNVIFDLQGRRVNNAAHGVYIVNGKKILVK